jgi:hypothetical protein
MTARVPRSLRTPLVRVRRLLVEERARLTLDEFEAACGSYCRYLELAGARPELGLPDVPLLFWLDNVFPRLSASDLISARNAWTGDPDGGFEEAFGDVSARLLPIPPGFRAEKRIGELAVDLGWTTPEKVAEALAIQKAVFEETGVRLLTGSILTARGDLSPVAYFQLLALIFGIPFRRVTRRTLDRIKKAFLKLRRAQYPVRPLCSREVSRHSAKGEGRPSKRTRTPAARSIRTS